MFSGLALMLGMLGVYGVTSHMVAQQTREIGVRIALGATKENVVKLVMREAFTMAIGGTAVGAGFGMWAAFLLWERMWGIYPVDVEALVIAEVTLLLVTIGVIVRATGSGMGCPDWPLCHGQIIPPLNDPNAWIEWVHRTVAAVIGFVVIALAFVAFRDHRDRPSLLWTSIAAVALVGLLERGQQHLEDRQVEQADPAHPTGGTGLEDRPAVLPHRLHRAVAPAVALPP